MDVILAEMFGKKPSFQFPTMITLKSFGNWYTYSSRNGWGLRAETQDMRAEAQDLRAEAQDLGAEAQMVRAEAQMVQNSFAKICTENRYLFVTIFSCQIFCHHFFVPSNLWVWFHCA